VTKLLQVDTDGLESDGRELASLSPIPKPTHQQCPSPASDPVSTSMAFAMSAYDEGLIQRLDEADEVREHGGAIVTASGVLFEVADEQGSLEIDRVDVLGEPRPASAGPPTIYQPAQPQTRATPSIPRLSPQLMGPEEFAEAVHAGNSLGVSDFADHWRDGSESLEHLGERVRHISDKIQEHWRDADSNASLNVRNHGTWLTDASTWAANFASSADKIAAAFDTAQADTPTPSQLALAKLALQASVAMGPAASLAAYLHYESLKNEAIEAGARYQNSVEHAINDVGQPVDAPTLIAKRAAIPPELVKGPGTWVTESRRDGNWREYEEQVTGYPAGMEYEVPRENGKPVDIDGFDPDLGPNGTFIEAKGEGHDWMVGTNGEFKDIPPAHEIENQITRRFEVAQETGIPVEYRVAEPELAEAIQQYIEDSGYEGRVSVVYIPKA